MAKYAKRVKETAAGKSIAAYVILKEGRPYAVIQAHYGDSGTVRVDIWAEEWKDVEAMGGDTMLIHQGRAGGYGYDKFGSAMQGSEKFFGLPERAFTYNGESTRVLEKAGYTVVRAM